MTTRRRKIHENQRAWNTLQPEGVENTTTRGRGIHDNQKAWNTRQPEGVEYTTTRRRGIHDNMVGPVYNGSICQFPNCSDGGEVLRGYLNRFFSDKPKLDCPACILFVNVTVYHHARLITNSYIQIKCQFTKSIPTHRSVAERHRRTADP